MSAARAEILAAIRAANAAADPQPARAAAVSPSPPAAGPDPAVLDLLAERLRDYRATVTRIGDRNALPDAVAAILARHDAQRIAVPPDLPRAWRPAHAEIVCDDPPLDHRALAALDGVLTGCALAIAETGTLVLDAGRAQGRRVLTLLPDLHVCVVAADQVVAAVPAAIAALADTRRPITLVSGPSATSDIELERVEGVHGPRRLEVVLVSGLS